MGTDVVELLSPPFECVTLRFPAPTWGRCNVGFERSMHAFVPTVLFGVARLDAFREDAEFDPPDAQTGHAADPRGGEGRECARL
jgi:hypothetical protein